MKNYIFCLLVILAGCDSIDQDSLGEHKEVIGEWKLIEILMDPGDGSGQFEATNYDITIEVSNKFKVTGNGILCGFHESDEELKGEYDAETSTIITSCESGTSEHLVNLDQENLILSRIGCREPCLAKFVRK